MLLPIVVNNSLIFNFWLKNFSILFQINDYARRKQEDSGAIEKWLGPVLAYDSE